MIQVEYIDNIMRTPALRLAVRGWNELLEADLADDGVSGISYDHKAFLASITGCPVGVLTFFDCAWANHVSVALAYVVPEYRRKGIHTKMWNALVEKTRDLKRPVIQSGTHVRNLASRSMMAKQGREETGIFSRYFI